MALIVDFTFSYIFVILFCAVLYKFHNYHTQPENNLQIGRCGVVYTTWLFSNFVLLQMDVFDFLCFTPSKSSTFSDFIP